MCLILFAFQYHRQFPLVVAANRDEFYARPTLPAHFWQQHPNLFAGRDMQAGGTWMGITTSGRFAAVTNYREPSMDANNNGQPMLSRGELTTDYLTTTVNAEDYLNTVLQNKTRYAGFNLLVGDEKQLLYYSNRMTHWQTLTPGIYGLSNGLLNEPWPKVESGKRELKTVLRGNVDPEPLLNILLDTTAACDKQLPDTGLGIEKERLLSSRFIRSEHYGTRASTVLIVDRQRDVVIWEQTADAQSVCQPVNKVQFQCEHQ